MSYMAGISNKGSLLLPTVGLGFQLSLNLFLVWDFADSLQSHANAGTGDWYMVYALATIAFYLVYAAISLIGSKVKYRPDAPGAHSLSLITSCCMVVGCTFALAASLGTVLPVVFYLSAVSMAAGIAGCAIAWVRRLAELNEKNRPIALLGGSLCSLPSFGIDLVLEETWYPAIMSLLSMGTLLTVLASLKRDPVPPGEVRDSAVENQEHGGRKGAKALLPELVCASVVSVVIFLERLIWPVADALLLDAQRLVFMQHVLSLMSLFIVLILLQRTPSIAGAFAFVFPLVALLVMAPLAGMPGALFANVVAGTLYVAFSTLIKPVSINLSRDLGVPLTATFCLIIAALLAGMPIARLIESMFARFGLMQDTAVMASTLVLLYAISVALYFILRFAKRREPSDGEKARGHCDPVEVGAMALQSARGLSPRQGEIVNLIAHGYDAAAIGEKLCLSENTVRTHIKRIYQHLDIHSKRELVELVAAHRNDDKRAGT